MPHVCRDCKRTFETELKLELHRDTCDAGELFCDECGARFAQRRATEDGWYFRCPDEDCDGEGIGEDIHQVSNVRVERATP